jgi:hypothetical protein
MPRILKKSLAFSKKKPLRQLLHYCHNAMACPGYTNSKKKKIITVDFFNEKIKFVQFFLT